MVDKPVKVVATRPFLKMAAKLFTKCPIVVPRGTYHFPSPFV